MLEWKSFTTYNIEVPVQSPQRELMVLFKVLLISCPPRCTFSPPSWTGSQAHITEYSKTSLRVFISQQIQLHQQTWQPRKPHYFIHSFLDQIDKVQGPAALNSSPAAHQQAPGTQQHLSSVPTGTEHPESHFQAEMLVMTTHNLFFGGTEITGTTLRYGLLILLKYAEVLCLQAGELGTRGLGFGVSWRLR